jgi:hypothetical protein
MKHPAILWNTRFEWRMENGEWRIENGKCETILLLIFNMEQIKAYSSIYNRKSKIINKNGIL